MTDRTGNESTKPEQNRDGEKNAHQLRRLESPAGREWHQPYAHHTGQCNCGAGQDVKNGIGGGLRNKFEAEFLSSSYFSAGVIAWPRRFFPCLN